MNILITNINIFITNKNILIKNTNNLITNMNILMTNKNKLITNIKNIYWSQVEYIELIDKNTLIPIDIDKYTDYKKRID